MAMPSIESGMHDSVLGQSLLDVQSCPSAPLHEA
jgi:hypothetical protein